MKLALPRFRLGFTLRALLMALMAAAALHIIVTLAAPMMTGASAYTRLSAQLPLHVMKVLPPLSPENQPLPFLGADARYAMCRFDTAKGVVAVSARLPEAGWTLSVFSSSGDNVYVAAGDAGQTPEIALLLVPSDDRFMGLTPEAGGSAAGQQGALKLAARKGLIVVRAPDRGVAYRRAAEAELARATCTTKPF